MKCNVRNRLEDYIDGELDARSEAEVSVHLQSCASCAGVHASFVEERRVYEAYAEADEKALAPRPEMWQRVRALLETPSPQDEGKGEEVSERQDRSAGGFFILSGIRRQLAFAALLITVSVSATLLAVRFWRPDRHTASLGDAREVRSASRSDHGDLENALMAIRRAEQDYIEAINLLSGIVERRKSTLEPQLAAELERNLQAIDSAIDSTRRAYRDRPQDPERALFMLHAYARKVELLQELVS